MKKTELMFDEEPINNKINEESHPPHDREGNETIIIGEDNKGHISEIDLQFELRQVTGWLVVINEAEKGTVFELGFGESTVGRNESFVVPLMLDKSVSRKACIVLTWNHKSKSHRVIPHQVSNPVYLNKQRLQYETVLTSYDVITVGRSELMYINPFE